MFDQETLEALRQELIRDEGVRSTAYQDSLGYWTIGVGRLIDSRKGGGLSQREIEFLLDNDIEEKEAELDKHLPWWRGLSPVRQRVLLNMCFNLGIGGLLKFKNTLAFIKAGDYSRASVEMLKSKWAEQVGKKQGQRAYRLASMMEHG